MSQSTKKIKINLGDKAVALDSPVIKENLPFKHVHYPNHYGCFFMFSDNQNSQPFFCECTKVSIENYFKLVHYEKGSYSDELITAPLSKHYFPTSICRESLKHKLSRLLQFRNKLCHRCNMTIPTLQYCHDMYGGNFKQTFGWYINLTSFRIGISFPNYIEEYTPQYWIDLMSNYKSFMSLREKLLKRSNAGEISWLEVNDLDKQMSKLKRSIDKELENITREEFGFKKVGDGNVCETILFKIIEKHFSEFKLLRHYRPKWLKGLELDIFIPELKLAYEYQGQQHYFPVAAWGGEAALEKLKQRDQLKRDICKSENIKLIEIDYTEPLNEDYLKLKTSA